MNGFQASVGVGAPDGETRDRLGEILGNDMRWLTTEALCAQVDTEMFFPKKGSSTRNAKRVCAACPLAAACLEYALTHTVYGVWGGTSQLDRRRLGARVA